MSAKDELIRQLEKELKERDDTILQLKKSLDTLNRQIENLTELILQMRHGR